MIFAARLDTDRHPTVKQADRENSRKDANQLSLIRINCVPFISKLILKEILYH